MQKAAIQVMEEFGGEFPNTYDGILSLKGIGPYTAGAIASIAFGLPEPAVDGNLMRVISRLFEVNLDIGNPSNRWAFQEIAEILIDPDRPGDFNQALMDLGSDIESPVNPRPEESPVKDFSSAYLNGTMHIYPIKKPKKKPTPMKWRAFVVKDDQGRFLVEKNTQADLLSGFWHFPLIEVDDFSSDDDQLDLFSQVKEESRAFGPSPQENFEQDYDLKVNWSQQVFDQVKHVFSHRKWHIQILAGQVAETKQFSDREIRWVSPQEFSDYPLAKPQQKIWQAYKTNLEDEGLQ